MGEHARVPIVVLIADDHRILTDTLASVVETDPDLRLAGPPVHTAEEAVALAAELRPDVLLMDVEFQGQMDGIEATRQVRRTCPETVVLIMTAHEDERVMVEAVEAGAAGFLRKTEGVDEFVDAIKAAAGEMLIDRAELARILPKVAREREARRETGLLFDRLTQRERAILELSARGLRTNEVATELAISPQTVQTHVRNILAKLDVHSKLEAVALAIRSGFVRL